VGAGDLLRRIDRRALPPLAAGIHRVGRGRRRLSALLLLALTGGAVVLLAAVVTGGRPPAGDETVGEVVRVGVAQGQSIPEYLDTTAGELAALATGSAPAAQTYALVMLSAYLAPDRVAPVVAGLAVSAVYARVPLPETQTEIVRIDAFRVPEDVVAGMDQVALRKDGEALDYRDLGAKLTGGGPQEQDLREVYDSGARVAEAEAEAYRRECSCVYAVVVRASPAQLARLAGRSEVRGVDPAPEVRRLDRAVFLPPLPEQVDVARPPEDTLLSERPSRPVEPVGSSIRRGYRALNFGGLGSAQSAVGRIGPAEWSD
jgi:hypothetical protein